MRFFSVVGSLGIEREKIFVCFLIFDLSRFFKKGREGLNFFWFNESFFLKSVWEVGRKKEVFRYFFFCWNKVCFIILVFVV